MSPWAVATGEAILAQLASDGSTRLPAPVVQGAGPAKPAVRYDRCTVDGSHGEHREIIGNRVTRGSRSCKSSSKFVMGADPPCPGRVALREGFMFGLRTSAAFL